MLNVQRAMRLATVAALVAGFSQAVSAQEPHTEPPPKYCWRGQPQPACNRFLITEFSVSRSIVTPVAKVPFYFSIDSGPTSYYEVRDGDWNATWEVGGMTNTSARNALGATLLLGFDGDGGTVGVKTRYRRWLNPEGIALDVGAGLRTSQSERNSYTYILGTSDGQPGPSPTFTGDIAINARDYVALVGRVDLVKFGGRYQPNISLGVRAGSKPAVIGTGALVTTYAVLLTVFLLAWDD